MHYCENKCKWDNLKVLLEAEFSNLTDEDFYFLEGKEVELLEILGIKTGLSRNKLIDKINKI